MNRSIRLPLLILAKEHRIMRGTKSIFASLGVWGGLVALLAGVAQLAGYVVSPADTAELGRLVDGLVTSAAGIAAIVGRIRATKRLVLAATDA